jgi:hypothetical protein
LGEYLDRQQGDLVGLILFFQNKESRLKIMWSYKQRAEDRVIKRTCTSWQYEFKEKPGKSTLGGMSLLALSRGGQ